MRLGEIGGRGLQQTVGGLRGIDRHWRPQVPHRHGRDTPGHDAKRQPKRLNQTMVRLTRSYANAAQFTFSTQALGTWFDNDAGWMISITSWSAPARQAAYWSAV